MEHQCDYVLSTACNGFACREGRTFSESNINWQMMTSGTAGPFEEPGTAKVTQHDVDIGIKWKREPAPAGNDVMEIVIQEIIPGGAADQVISKH